MKPGNPSLSAELLALRREFDDGFSNAPETRDTSSQNFLGIRLGGDAFAIRVAEIAGMHKNRSVAAMPSQVPTFLGVAGFRGQIVPVYDLATLLGYADRTTPRWMILVRTGEPVALAFDVFETHFSARSGDIIPAPQSATPSSTVRDGKSFESVRSSDGVRPIIHLPTMTELIQHANKTSLRHRRISS
jgi:chemotaxis signal transduction protein